MPHFSLIFISSEIIKIVHDIEGVDVRELLNNEFDCFKDRLSHMAKEQSFDIDLSDIKLTGSKEELVDKIERSSGVA